MEREREREIILAGINDIAMSVTTFLVDYNFLYWK